jgi:hypothetical protein
VPIPLYIRQLKNVPDTNKKCMSSGIPDHKDDKHLTKYTAEVVRRKMIFFSIY